MGQEVCGREPGDAAAQHGDVHVIPSIAAAAAAAAERPTDLSRYAFGLDRAASPDSNGTAETIGTVMHLCIVEMSRKTESVAVIDLHSVRAIGKFRASAWISVGKPQLDVNSLINPSVDEQSC